MSNFDRLQRLYQTGQTPWDHELPPPEIEAIAEVLPPGRALDLGCGYGRASIYLACRGWLVDGVDFIPEAVAEAARRAEAAGVTNLVHFHRSPVTAMPFLEGLYDIAIDVGCMHDMDGPQLVAYRDEVRRLVRPGGKYLLFAHLRGFEIEYDDQGRPRWVTGETIVELFQESFTLEHSEHGTTQVGDRPPYASAWFWFRRGG